MKKEKSLNFLCSKWLMVSFFALGMLLIGNIDAQAQSPLSTEITYMTNIRDSFVQGSAKYDIADQALDYFLLLDANISSDPNYLNNLQDQTGIDPFKAVPIRRAGASILAEYSAAQLASFSAYISAFNAGNVTSSNESSSLVEFSGSSNDPVNAIGAQKRQWILDANAY
jgi:hypothetical protein